MVTTLRGVNKLFEFQRFFRILATRVGSLLNYSDISKEVGVADTTIFCKCR
jgi:predicted AAA+ superfamily ATPase